MIGIYKITSPNKKIYIGQSINIEKRFKWYLRLYGPNIQPKIYKSLKKHGPENHIFEVIEECFLDQLNKREIYYKQQIIDEFGWDKALFCEIYDSGGGPKSEETKRKIGEGNKGKIISEEHKFKTSNTYKNMSLKDKQSRSYKLSKSLKGNGLGKIGPMNGKQHTKLTKQKMSKSRLGKKDSDKTKNIKSQIKLGHIKDNKWKKNLSESASKSFGRPILQKDLKGNIIKEWETGKKAANKLGLSYIAINTCCVKNEKNLPRKRDKLKIGKYVSLNYIWEYKNKSTKKII